MIQQEGGRRETNAHPLFFGEVISERVVWSRHQYIGGEANVAMRGETRVPIEFEPAK